jgi:hypothetical protein
MGNAPGNGQCLPCEFNAAEWDAFRGEVLRLTGSVQTHDRLMDGLKDLPDNVRSLRDIAIETGDKLGRLSDDVASLNAWRSDDKTQRIVSLTAELKRRDEVIERDRLDFRRSVKTGLISALFTLLLVSLPTAWLMHKATAEPPNAAQVHMP